MVRIRLTRKLAVCLNGPDMSALRVGDVTELPDSAAAMMIAEGWAEPVPVRSLPVISLSSRKIVGNLSQTVTRKSLTAPGFAASAVP